MDSAAEGRPLAIFGRPGRALLPSRIRFWYSFFTFLGHVGPRILCAGACARIFFPFLGFTLESGFYAQARVSGFEFVFFDILGGTPILIVYQYLRVPG